VLLKAIEAALTGRAEQLLAQRDTCSMDLVFHGKGLFPLKEGLAGEDETIAMNPVALNADNPISRFQIATHNNLVERHHADRGPRQIEAADDISELGGLTPGN